jgi:hypothetical protein
VSAQNACSRGIEAARLLNPTAAHIGGSRAESLSRSVPLIRLARAGQADV